jgi:uncharacterized membrane protein
MISTLKFLDEQMKTKPERLALYLQLVGWLLLVPMVALAIYDFWYPGHTTQICLLSGMSILCQVPCAIVIYRKNKQLKRDIHRLEMGMVVFEVLDDIFKKEPKSEKPE